MNCPNCGAENEAGARFCIECGAPLETQVNLPNRPPEVDDMDNDRTIMSSFGRLAEEAKTVAVTQEQLAAAEAEAASTFERGPEPEVIPPTSLPSGGSGGGGGGNFGSSGGSPNWMNRRNIIIAVVVLLVLCCCCCALGVGGSIGSDPDAFEDLMRELGSLPLTQFFI